MKKPSLEAVTNVTIIVFCLVVGFVLIRTHFFPPQPPAAQVAIRKGDRVEILKRTVPSGSSRALLLALSPQCGFCSQSIPFYRRLVAERVRGRPRHLSLVGVVANAAQIPEEKQLLAAAGVELDHWAAIDFTAARLPGTPTLVLLDDSGRVDEVWVGKLDGPAEERVVERLAGSI